MEGEGVSTGAIGGTAIGGGGGSFGGATSLSGGGGGFESIGAGSDSIGIGAPSIGSEPDIGSSISVFEAGYQSAPGDAPTLGIVEKEIVPIGDSVPTIDNDKAEIAHIESGVIDAVGTEGTPEAGFQFLSDVPIIDEGPVVSSGDAVPSGKTPDVAAAVEPELLPLTTEQRPRQTRQEQVQSYISANPDVANAVGNIIALTPESLAAMMLALKKMLEEEQKKAKKELGEGKMSKKMMALLAFFLLVELMFKAAEKGAKEATR